MPSLYKYQEDGVSFLRSAKRAILGDEPGVGKTPQGIVAAAGFAQTLVVVPSLEIAKQWEERIGEWDPESEVWVTMERGAHRLEAKWVITNYDAISIDETKDEATGKKIKKPASLMGRVLLPKKWPNIIFDEAHKLKNHKSQRGVGGYYLAKKASNVYLLTGSPLLNRVDELWALLRVCDPVKYKSRWKFLIKHAAAGPGVFGWEYTESATDPEALRAEISPYFIRRTREETEVDRPEVTIDHIILSPSDKQVEALATLEKDCALEHKNGVLTYDNSLTYFTAMHKVCSTPWELLLGAGPKIKWVEEFVSATDKKVVIFCENVTTTHFIQETLSDVGVSVYHGGLNDKLKSEEMEDFVNGENQVMVLTIDAGHLGLDRLKVASLMIMYDEDWTPEINAQCIARLDRKGQKNAINVYSLHIDHEVDRRKRESNDSKEKLIKDIMEAKLWK